MIISKLIGNTKAFNSGSAITKAKIAIISEEDFIKSEEDIAKLVDGKIAEVKKQNNSQGSSQSSSGSSGDKPKKPEDVFFVHFNPNTIKITDGVEYGYSSKEEKAKSYVKQSNRRVPVAQYSVHKARELSVELLFDTYTSKLKDAEKESVKKVYIDDFVKLLHNKDKDGAPPFVFFSWGQIQFRGSVTSMSTTYTVFTSTGVPARATMSLTITEYGIEEKKES